MKHVRMLWRPGLAFVFCLGVAGALAARPPDKSAKPPVPPAGQAPEIEVRFHKGDAQLPLATMRFGILLPKLPAPQLPSRLKQLTYDPWGRTSNTCLKIDGNEYLLGQAPGKWLEREGKLGNGRQGLRSLWIYPDEKVMVTQTVEVVRGEQTGNVDTCRVEYLIENKAEGDRNVGLRFLLDTFIGTNDGAPFILPGDRSICDTDRDLKGAKVPAFAQALERLDFKDPGVVAHLKLKMGGGLEDPDRVTFGNWPDPRTRLPGASGEKTLWNVPVASMQLTKDSAAVLYWNEKKLPAGGSRKLGFTYGLGNFSSDPEGKLGLILAGSFKVGSEMTILALLKDPQEGQTASLKLPKELKLVGAGLTQKVPPAGGSGISPVAWTVQTPEEGILAFTVETSGGTSLRQGVRINPAGTAR